MIRKHGKSERSKAIKNLDILWSKAIRTRDPICRKCKKVRSSQAAHIFTRNNLSTRWEKRNGLGLCFYCHIFWGHRNPIEFTEWVIGEMGKVQFEALRRRTKELYQFTAKDYEKVKNILGSSNGETKE